MASPCCATGGMIGFSSAFTLDPAAGVAVDAGVNVLRAADGGLITVP
jgi:hypothetical protein